MPLRSEEQIIEEIKENQDKILLLRGEVRRLEYINIGLRWVLAGVESVDKADKTDN